MGIYKEQYNAQQINEGFRNDIQLKKYGIDINNNKFYLAINVNNITNNILYTRSNYFIILFLQID